MEDTELGDQPLLVHNLESHEPSYVDMSALCDALTSRCYTRKRILQVLMMMRASQKKHTLNTFRYKTVPTESTLPTQVYESYLDHTLDSANSSVNALVQDAGHENTATLHRTVATDSTLPTQVYEQYLDQTIAGATFSPNALVQNAGPRHTATRSSPQQDILDAHSNRTKRTSRSVSLEMLADVLEFNRPSKIRSTAKDSSSSNINVQKTKRKPDDTRTSNDSAASSRTSTITVPATSSGEFLSDNCFNTGTSNTATGSSLESGNIISDQSINRKCSDFTGNIVTVISTPLSTLSSTTLQSGTRTIATALGSLVSGEQVKTGSGNTATGSSLKREAPITNEETINPKLHRTCGFNTGTSNTATGSSLQSGDIINDHSIDRKCSDFTGNIDTVISTPSTTSSATSSTSNRTKQDLYQSSPFKCLGCVRSFNSRMQLDEHLSGKSHKRIALAQVGHEAAAQKSSSFVCLDSVSSSSQVESFVTDNQGCKSLQILSNNHDTSQLPSFSELMKSFELSGENCVFDPGSQVDTFVSDNLLHNPNSEERAGSYQEQEHKESSGENGVVKPGPQVETFVGPGFMNNDQDIQTQDHSSSRATRTTEQANSHPADVCLGTRFSVKNCVVDTGPQVDIFVDPFF